MVSQSRKPASSRDRLLAAAAAEFAARGFAGAKVDRIAARARLNKAMIYYHFRSKAALYREVLLDVFRTIADAVSEDAADESPEAGIRHFIRSVAGVLAERPHFAPIWLREMAEGGMHLDASLAGQLQRVLGRLERIVHGGRRRARHRAVHPLAVQLGIVGPILLFLASTPVRARLAPPAGDVAGIDIDYETLLNHVEAATLGAMTQEAPAVDGSTRRRGA